MARAELQQLIITMQGYQQQLQAASMQKEALNLQLMDISKAVSEMEKKPENDVFKAAGPILIKEKSSAVMAELGEKRELITLRIKSMEKTESKLKEKIDEIREKVAKESGGMA